MAGEIEAGMAIMKMATGIALNKWKNLIDNNVRAFNPELAARCDTEMRAWLMEWIKSNLLDEPSVIDNESGEGTE